MTSKTQAKALTWDERHAEIAAADDDEWDRLSEAFNNDWHAAYVTEFVRFALTRNWVAKNALEWASEIKDYARTDGYRDPVKQACMDVVECEIEYANVVS